MAMGDRESEGHLKNTLQSERSGSGYVEGAILEQLEYWGINTNNHLMLAAAKHIRWMREEVESQKKKESKP